MDKKTEMALRNRSKALQAEAEGTAEVAPAATTVPLTAAATLPPAPVGQPPSGWWMYHGDPEHTGFVSDSDLNSASVASKSFTTLHSIQLEGPVLSVPAVTDGFIYVGLANYQQAQGGNGGALHKIDIQTGTIVNTFAWDLGCDPRDAHSFTGMGSTPAVVNGRVYFGAFNGKFYCLDQETLTEIWFTDLRQEDILHHQPITNMTGVDMGAPPAVMWSSPVLSADGTKVYVGCGEGENPQLFSFVFCLDTATGNVNWIFCTNKFTSDEDNQPNFLPAAVLQGTVPPTFTPVNNPPIVMGSSVWGSIAYDKDLNRLYCSTGNQQPEPNANWNWNGVWPPPPFTPELPSLGYSNGVLSLDSETGAFKAFFQVPHDSNYRPSDGDIDLGGAPILFKWNAGQADEEKVVGAGCKNGSFFVLNADTLELHKHRQLLPYFMLPDGTLEWIETVDRHPNPADGTLSPHLTNEYSNSVPNENFSGIFNTAAIYPGSNDNPQTISQRVFLAMGGPNYHSASPGIDYESTPFMRAIDAASLEDVWPMAGNPLKYTKTSRMDPNLNTEVGMYSSAGESGLSSPAVVNDVVFCTTSKISIYAFGVRDGTLLWNADLGMQTDGYNGGYGYCLGPAIWKNYVVAGALIFGGEGGGVLNIYGLTP
jgi:outer membrane protein assembly factor BamB